MWPAFANQGNCTSLPLRLGPSGSVFVVFRQKTVVDPVVALTRDGQTLLPSTPRKAKIAIQWARYGVPGDPQHSRDVRAKLQAIVDNGQIEVHVASIA